jgi:RNA polymerase sigma-70 factor (ECF subfamily)
VDRERILIEDSQSAHVKAFEELILSYEKKAYNIAYKVLRDEQDALDASQEAFIKLYKNISKFQFQSSFSTWLYRIVMNTALDFKKKKKPQIVSLNETYEDGNEKLELIDKNLTPEKALENKLSREFIKKGIDSLDDDHRTVILLRDVEGFSYDEIAEITSSNKGTVKSRINRGRKKLKKWLIDSGQNYKT